MDHKNHERRQAYRRVDWRHAWLAILAIVPTACTTQRAQIAKGLAGAEPAPVIREQTVEEGYRIACPDVVEIKVDERPEITGDYTVTAEGRIALTALDNPRVEGHTTASLADCVASELGLADGAVHCRVKRHRSRVVFVRGPVNGGDRAELYRGPENVVSFLRRCGGLLPGADLRDVHIVRCNIAQGGKPQAFVVDLEGILLRGEPKTNVLIQPFDEVCIGELPRSKIGKALPHWLSPFYRGFCGMLPCFCPHNWRQQSRDQEP